MPWSSSSAASGQLAVLKTLGFTPAGLVDGRGQATALVVVARSWERWAAGWSRGSGGGRSSTASGWSALRSCHSSPRPRHPRRGGVRQPRRHLAGSPSGRHPSVRGPGGPRSALPLARGDCDADRSSGVELAGPGRMVLEQPVVLGPSLERGPHLGAEGVHELVAIAGSTRMATARRPEKAATPVATRSSSEVTCARSRATPVLHDVIGPPEPRTPDLRGHEQRAEDHVEEPHRGADEQDLEHLAALRATASRFRESRRRSGTLPRSRSVSVWRTIPGG